MKKRGDLFFCCDRLRLGLKKAGMLLEGKVGN
jgi:hypothetical protein